jgi:hypothetical protein
MDKHKLPDPVTISQIVNTVVDAFVTILKAIEGHSFAALILLLALAGVVVWAWRPRKVSAQASTAPVPPSTVINNNMYFGRGPEKGRHVSSATGRGDYRIDDITPHERPRAPRVIYLNRNPLCGASPIRRADGLAPIRVRAGAHRRAQPRKVR